MADSQSRIILLHLPKAGGSTLKVALKWKYPSRTLDLESVTKPLAKISEEVPEATRRDARVVVGHLHYGVHEQFPGPSAYVTVLREPVARVISMYHYIARDPRHRLHDTINAGMSLEEFVGTSADPGVVNQQTRMIAGVGAGELAPGGAVPEVGPQTLELAKRNLERFLVVGVSERFDETFLLLRRALGWKLPMYVSEKVARGPKPASDEGIALIRERNRLDAELHRFAEDLLDSAITAEGRSFKRELIAFKLLNRVPEAIGPRVPAPLRRRIRSVLPR